MTDEDKTLFKEIMMMMSMLRISNVKADNYPTRKCPYCSSRLSFPAFVAGQSLESRSTKYEYEFFGMTNDRYEELERMWSDTRIALLCCRCLNHLYRSPTIIEDIMQAIMKNKKDWFPAY